MVARRYVCLAALLAVAVCVRGAGASAPPAPPPPVAAPLDCTLFVDRERGNDARGGRSRTAAVLSVGRAVALAQASPVLHEVVCLSASIFLEDDVHVFIDDDDDGADLRSVHFVGGGASATIWSTRLQHGSGAMLSVAGEQSRFNNAVVGVHNMTLRTQRDRCVSLAQHGVRFETSDAAFIGCGTGVNVDAATPEASVVLSKTLMLAYGTGVELRNERGTLSMEATTVRGASAAAFVASGAGASVSLSNCTLTRSGAARVSGGGAPTVVFDNVVMADCSDGARALLNVTGDAPRVSMRRCSMARCKSGVVVRDGSGSGGSGASELHVAQCSFEAINSGGAVDTTNVASVSVASSEFSNTRIVVNTRGGNGGERMVAELHVKDCTLRFANYSCGAPAIGLDAALSSAVIDAEVTNTTVEGHEALVCSGVGSAVMVSQSNFTDDGGHVPGCDGRAAVAEASGGCAMSVERTNVQAMPGVGTLLRAENASRIKFDGGTLRGAALAVSVRGGGGPGVVSLANALVQPASPSAWSRCSAAQPAHEVRIGAAVRFVPPELGMQRDANCMYL